MYIGFVYRVILLLSRFETFLSCYITGSDYIIFTKRFRNSCYVLLLLGLYVFWLLITIRIIVLYIDGYRCIFGCNQKGKEISLFDSCSFNPNVFSRITLKRNEFLSLLYCVGLSALMY